MSKNPIERVSDWIADLYSTRATLLLLLAVAGFAWLFMFSSLPLSNPELVKLSGHEGLLDLMPYYSAQEAFTALTHYGEAGRKLYLRYLAADFVFIPAHTFGLAFLMTGLVRSVSDEPSPWLLLNVLPLATGLFDCVEDLAILRMLFLYPETSVAVGTLSGIAMLCKRLFIVATLLVLVFGALRLLMRRL